MKKLFIDFETRAVSDLKTVGAHRYATNGAEITLVSWAVDDGPVHVEEVVPEEIRRMLEDDDVLKIAHNAEFDAAITQYVLGIPVNPDAWWDTAYQAAYFGYPRALSALAQHLHTTTKASSEEMLLFASPIKPSRRDISRGVVPSGPVWCTKYSHPDEWARFVEYSMTDTIVLRECYKAMPSLPAIEVFAMRHTMRINFEGVPFDAGLAMRIKARADKYSSDASNEAREKYGIENLRSTPQVKEALRRAGVHLTSLNKKERAGEDHEILRLRDQATGSSFSKIPKAFERLCDDGRLRGELVGYGAHTGRWSSRGVQMQNFARIQSEVSDDLANVKSYDHLRQHLRLCIYAPEPYNFICADLSQIEARIVAWLSGCEWRMRAFENGEDIYARSAERMFGLPHVDKSMPERQMGKCAELGLGYGGAVNAIARVAPDFYREQGDEKVADIVRKWRAANPEICSLWRVTERAFAQAMRSGVCKMRCGDVAIVIRYNGETATITLPSGRALYYRKVTKDYDGTLRYLDFSSGQFATSVKFWGGTLVENIVQAVARDVLVDIMQRVYRRRPEYKCIGSVHDEVWYLSKDKKAINVLLEEMARPVSWAPGLITKGDGFASKRYIK